MRRQQHLHRRTATRPENLTTGTVRRRFIAEGRLPAPAAEVFRELCPTREYDWIVYWDCRLLFSESGYAEEDCIFSTELGSHETWVVTRYEPSERIEFCIFSDDEVIVRLKIVVTDGGDGTCETRWERLYTAVGPQGRVRVDGLVTSEVEGRMREVIERLSHFLEQGEMLRRAPTTH